MYLNKFDEFLFDKLLEKVNVNELPFILTKRLYDILNKMEHPIAKNLISLNDKKEEKKLTLIDYDDIIFSPNDKLENIYKRFTFLNSNKAYDNISNQYNIELDKIKSILTTISYIGDNDRVYNWFKKNRSSIKIGSFIKKVFGDKFKDAGDYGNDITSFVNIFSSLRKSLEDGHNGFEIVNGNDIVYWYNGRNNSIGGTLGESCMRYNRCSEYIEFYAINKETISLLILKDPLDATKIVGRALVWTLIKPEGRYFMDRIYYTSDKYIELFKNYAKENGWLYKKYQNYDEYTDIIDSLNNKEKQMTLVANCVKNSYYPFLDTMKFFSYEKKLITNDFNYLNDSDEYYILNSTGGDYSIEQTNNIYVEYYDRFFNVEDLVWCELGEEYRLPDDVVEMDIYFDFKNATSEYVEENLEWSEYEDTYIYKYDAIWSEYEDSYLSIGDAIEIIISADYDTFEEAIDDDDNKEYRGSGRSYIDYLRKGEYYYFSNDSKDDNTKFFIKTKTTYGEQFKHIIWDKNNIIKLNGVMHYADNQKDIDLLRGQLRLFDKKNNNI